MESLEGVGAIIADPSSLFCRILLDEFEKRGQPTVLLNRWRYWPEGGAPKQVTTKELEGTLGGRAASALSAAGEFLLRHTATANVQEDLDREAEAKLPPLGPILADAVSIGLAVRKLKPKFVFGQDVLLSGPAVAACTGTTRILMPFGGDIFHYSEISRSIKRLVGLSLRRADLVVPSASSSADRLRNDFHVPPSKVWPIGWGVDAKLFRPRPEEERRALRARYGIAEDALVVINLRRMQPLWGSDVIADAFLQLASTRPDFHGIVMSGLGDAAHVHELRARFESAGLSGRGTFFDQDVPLAEYADLLALSDLGVSAMRVVDMRSWSILQAAASGVVPLLVDQPEYQAMTSDGLQAVFFRDVDAGQIVDAVNRSAADDQLRLVRERNRDFIVQKESFDTQMDKLVGRVVALSEGRL